MGYVPPPPPRRKLPPNCRACGAPTDERSEFCDHCGTRYRALVDWSVEYPVPDGIQKFFIWDDLGKGNKVMLFGKWREELWLFFWRRDAWKPLRLATERDIAAIDEAIKTQGAFDVRNSPK